MKRQSTYAVAAVAVAGLGILLSLVAPKAVAQIKAALVKNVDERGRQPYEVSAGFTVFGCGVNCSNFFFQGPTILFDLPAVPAGKRLIVQQVSGALPSTSSDGASAVLQSSQSIAPNQNVKWAFYGPFFPQFGESFSAPAFTTYGPGESPHFYIFLPNKNSIFDSSVTVSGYLIDATN